MQARTSSQRSWRGDCCGRWKFPGRTRQVPRTRRKTDGASTNRRFLFSPGKLRDVEAQAFTAAHQLTVTAWVAPRRTARSLRVAQPVSGHVGYPSYDGLLTHASQAIAASCHPPVLLLPAVTSRPRTQSVPCPMPLSGLP